MKSTFTPIQTTILKELSAGRKLFQVLTQPGMPSKATLDSWTGCPEYAAAYSKALAQGSGKRDRQRTRNANRKARAVGHRQAQGKPVKQLHQWGKISTWNPVGHPLQLDALARAQIRPLTTSVLSNQRS